MKQPSPKFWDRIAKRYAMRPVADDAAYQNKLGVTRRYFRPDMEVLEIGCGTGSTAIAHAPFLRHIHAIDISSRMIEIAKSKAVAAEVQNISFECSSMERLEVVDRSLDAVLALSILHLLESKERAVTNVYRMLKPGGIFVSSTACLGDTMKFFKLIGPIGSFLGLIPTVKVFTRSELLQCLRNTRFEIVHEWQPGKGKAVFVVARKPL